MDVFVRAYTRVCTRIRTYTFYIVQVPEHWAKHNGVIIPMHQREAMWVSFGGNGQCAVKMGVGGKNAMTGSDWKDDDETRANPLASDPYQNYMVRPSQPWLDGFHSDEKTVRQFVAMPLGEGKTVEAHLNKLQGDLNPASVPVSKATGKKKTLAELDEQEYSDAKGRLNSCMMYVCVCKFMLCVSGSEYLSASVNFTCICTSAYLCILYLYMYVCVACAHSYWCLDRVSDDIEWSPEEVHYMSSSSVSVRVCLKTVRL